MCATLLILVRDTLNFIARVETLTIAKMINLATCNAMK
jgi:hypothetical protein